MSAPPAAAATGGDWYFVTGCDTGFGREAVQQLASAGVNVFAAVYLEASVAEVQAEAAGAKGKVVAVRLDVTSDESVAAAGVAVRAVLGKAGRLLGVVNNAGLMADVGPVEWTPLSNHKAMMEVNYMGTVRVTNEFLPLIRRAEGRIVNVASIAGRIGMNSLGAYCATKHAVEGYNDALRRELLPFGVTVHLVEPGVFAGTNLYSTFCKGFDKLFAAADEDVKRDYGEEYKDSLKEEMTYMFSIPTWEIVNGLDVSQVPKAYVHALLSKAPHYRYRVGRDSKYLVSVAANLHESVQDALTNFSWGVPAQTKGQASPTALERANRRYGGWPLARRLIFSLLGVLVYRFIKRRFDIAA